jgi:hypothetical protein
MRALLFLGVGVFPSFDVSISLSIDPQYVIGDGDGRKRKKT